ncbi:MAG TPA: DUF2267 domain-containing protein [Nitrospira sp.]|nr:DUF2267 domain-containing protein [Nitrospira sp.]
MSLREYRRPRLVVLNPRSPVVDAARAVEHNNIGAVLVQAEGEIRGIVTDRDLAIRVVGRGRDSQTTELADVMTAPVAVLSPADSHQDAIRLMQERNIRRVPLVEEGRLVGIVTFDDLLLDEAAPLEELAAIVEAQIGEGGPAAPVKARRAARTEATYRRLLHQLRAQAALETAAEAETVLEVVLGSLVRRLTPDEAKDLIAQLPSRMQPALLALPPGPDKGISRQTIEAALVERLHVDPARAAQLVAAVGVTITQRVSRGQIQDVRAQLPDDLRSIFEDVRSAAA